MEPGSAPSTNSKAVRPAVMSVAYREKAALYAAYMPHVQRGGIFVPTTRPANLGDSVYLILTLMDDPAKYPVAGHVVWINPSGVPGKQQGIGIQFPEDATGDTVRHKIENLLGTAIKSSRVTHTL